MNKKTKDFLSQFKTSASGELPSAKLAITIKSDTDKTKMDITFDLLPCSRNLNKKMLGHVISKSKTVQNLLTNKDELVDFDTVLDEAEKAETLQSEALALYGIKQVSYKVTGDKKLTIIKDEFSGFVSLLPKEVIEECFRFCLDLSNFGINESKVLLEAKAVEKKQ